MKLKILFIINAIIALVFGLAFVAVPAKVIAQYGNTADDPLIYTGRLLGAALIGFAVLTWAARNAEESKARKAIVLALFIAEGIGAVVALIGQLQGVVNSMGWVNVAIYFLLALGYGCFLVKKPTAPKVQAKSENNK